MWAAVDFRARERRSRPACPRALACSVTHGGFGRASLAPDDARSLAGRATQPSAANATDGRHERHDEDGDGHERVVPRRTTLILGRANAEMKSQIARIVLR